VPVIGTAPVHPAARVTVCYCVPLSITASHSVLLRTTLYYCVPLFITAYHSLLLRVLRSCWRIRVPTVRSGRGGLAPYLWRTLCVLGGCGAQRCQRCACHSCYLLWADDVDAAALCQCEQAQLARQVVPAQAFEQFQVRLLYIYIYIYIYISVCLYLSMYLMSMYLRIYISVYLYFYIYIIL